MAKWGEGDPRWIVEERPDATNVNNWHWSEKNASDWSTTKLKNLFNNLKIQAPGLGLITINEISKCEGEAIANNRKGKLIFFYEWSVELEWKGTPDKEEDEEEEINGKIEILNLSEENLSSEIDISVSCLKGKDLGEKFKEFIRLKGIEYIKEKVADYIEALKVEYAHDLILPTKNQPQAVTKQSKTMISQDLANNIRNISMNCPAESKSESSGVKFDTVNINLSQCFKCRADDLFKALTIREMVCAFTRNDVKIDAKVGGRFELFGGNVSGEFVELILNEKIVQTWRFKSWPSNHHSEVVIKITEEEDRTRVDLTQKGIPNNDVERTRQGWQKYYWDALKRTFGFGADLI